MRHVLTSVRILVYGLCENSSCKCRLLSSDLVDNNHKGPLNQTYNISILAFDAGSKSQTLYEPFLALLVYPRRAEIGDAMLFFGKVVHFNSLARTSARDDA